MTTFRATRPVAAESVTAAIAAVRSHGLRVSTSRRMVLEALFTADGPVTAERIATGIDGQLPPLDVGSVYRNLETLEELGVVRHFHAGHGAGLYTLAGRDRAEYLVCESCHAVAPLDPSVVAPVRSYLQSRVGWDAHFAHFPIVGTCPDCRGAIAT